MAYRNKVYVAFDADSDIHYYRLMQAWRQSDHSTFDFLDAHDLNNLMRNSLEKTIKDKLRERLRNTKVFVILIGPKTKYLYKFVRWEIEQALKLGLPVIAVNLNKRRSIDIDRCPPILRDQLAMHVSFNAKILEFALDQWVTWHYRHVADGKTGPYYYEDSIYSKLGL